MKMMMRNLSIELAPLGITINNIAPGAIETPINTELLNDPVKLKALLDNIPLDRLGKPADVASAVAFLASSECRLHHRHHAGDRWRPDLELFRAVDGRAIVHDEASLMSVSYNCSDR